MSSLSLLGRAVQDERQPCRLQDLVTSTEGLLTPTLPKSIHLRSRLSDDDLRVLVNTDQLQQTLVNLVLNAREAMPDGGAIEIGAETDSRDAETTLLWVEDEGHGIPLALQDLVMESFFTTKESGTGLGLAVAQRVVGDHGGRLSFTSQPGQGTRFEIRLPRMAAESSQEAARVVEAGAGEVVVSYLPVRLARTVGSYLPAANYRLREATSADDLLDLVRVAQQESDDAERYLQAIILSDESDGREVLARLRGDGCRTPVLLIGKEGARDGGKLDSRTVFLAQPVDGFALLRRLNERLGPYRTHSSSLFNRQVS